MINSTMVQEPGKMSEGKTQQNSFWKQFICQAASDMRMKEGFVQCLLGFR